MADHIAALKAVLQELSDVVQSVRDQPGFQPADRLWPLLFRKRDELLQTLAAAQNDADVYLELQAAQLSAKFSGDTNLSRVVSEAYRAGRTLFNLIAAMSSADDEPPSAQEILQQVNDIQEALNAISPITQHLNQENAQLHAENARLRVNSNVNAVTQLQAENSQLRAANVQLQIDRNLLRQLQADNAQLQADNAQLQADNAQLQADNAQLQAQIQGAQLSSEEEKSSNRSNTFRLTTLSPLYSPTKRTPRYDDF